MFHLGKCLTVAAICIGLSSLGCTKTSDPSSPDSGPSPTGGPSSDPGGTSTEKGSQDGSASTTNPGQAGSRPTKPLKVEVPVAKLAEVKLSGAHASLCIVKVGDTMPEVELPDLSGSLTQLSSLYGEKLTVVVFWSGKVAGAREELADLGPDVAAPHSGQGLKVVGIAVGETAESAKGRLEDAEATYPNLLDEDGSAFSKVGTEKLPRTFLLDAQGKILWFDIEYSRSTRRELRDGITSALGQSS